VGLAVGLTVGSGVGGSTALVCKHSEHKIKASSTALILSTFQLRYQM